VAAVATTPLIHPPQTDPAPPRTPLLLYDGECGLCNLCVRGLLRIDRRGLLRFAPLQGPTAQAILRARGLPTVDFDSLVFVPDHPSPTGPVWVRTEGVLRIFSELGGVWRAFAALRILPGWLRDFAYTRVARMRHALFGEYRPSPLRRPEWAARFLP
jgi:predicted DCC family thiol-disulfide oxidoreductase YuxK